MLKVGMYILGHFGHANDADDKVKSGKNKSIRW